MNNEKIENLLNLAMDATPEERRKSMNLNVGFDRETDTWEVVVKFYGTKEQLEEIFYQTFGEIGKNIAVEGLSNEYVILQIPENLVNEVADIPEIEYMEKPKQLFFAVNNGKSVSCINPLQIRAEVTRTDEKILTGKGVLVAIVDSGERVIIMSS